jgi:hypothetical protein
MCDYSLMCLPNRLAVEGEQLVAHRFPTGAVGLASPSDLRKAAGEPCDQTEPPQWMSVIRSWLSPLRPEMEKIPAVCVPPGAQLMLLDISERMQRELDIGAAEEVTFIQMSARPYEYRDGFRFTNGREILLQGLQEGQCVEVLCFCSDESREEEHQRHQGDDASLRVVSRSKS